MNTNFLKACKGENTSHTPVWFMRQAGRYQPEYRAIRKEHTLMDIVERPHLCAQVTELPVKQLNVDAAILFSDIMTPVAPMGIPFEIKGGYGPYVENPIRHISDIERIRIPCFEEQLPHVGQTIQILRNQLDVPLIGFCGAPYTLASYLIEGGKSKNYLHMKKMMYADTKSWEVLMDKLVKGMERYLRYQVRSGAQAIQIFDSWVGMLNAYDYDKYVLPYLQDLFASLKPLKVPLIYFGVNTYHLLRSFVKVGADVLGIDYRIRFSDARKIVGSNITLQGNLNPATVLMPWEIAQAQVKSVLDDMNKSEGAYVFNLGHGCIPEMETMQLRRIVDYVHSYKRKNV